MGKYFRTIYLYIVAFGTLCMVVTGFVGTVQGVVAYFYPVVETYSVDFGYTKDYDYDYDYEYYEEEEIATDYQTLQEVETVEKRAKLKETFTYLAVFVCGTPLYLFHTRQLKKESEKEV